MAAEWTREVSEKTRRYRHITQSGTEAPIVLAHRKTLRTETFCQGLLLISASGLRPGNLEEVSQASDSLFVGLPATFDAGLQRPETHLAPDPVREPCSVETPVASQSAVGD